MNLNEGDLFDEHYQLISLIDSGGFSEVWKARYITGDKIVALKVYPRLGDEGAKSVENEYSKFFELQHSNLLNARHFGRYQGHPYLVMRYYSGGNAASKIGELPEAEIAKCMSQIASALKYLHAKGIAHLDIKPNNFLLDECGDYHLADLGLSMKLRNTIRRYTQTKHPSTLVTSVGITPVAYRAPELCNDEDITASLGTDIWAMGASFYELVTTHTPYGEGGWSRAKSERTIKSLPTGYSEGLYVILKKCLSENEADRPSAAQLEKWPIHFLETGAWSIPLEMKASHSRPAERIFDYTTKVIQKEPVVESGISAETNEDPAEKAGKFVGKRYWMIGVAVVVVFYLIKLIVITRSSNSSYDDASTANNTVTTDTPTSAIRSSTDTTSATMDAFKMITTSPDGKRANVGNSTSNSTSKETIYKEYSSYVTISGGLQTFRNELPAIDSKVQDTSLSKYFIYINYTKDKNYISINDEVYNFDEPQGLAWISQKEFTRFNCIKESDGSPFDIYYETGNRVLGTNRKIIVVSISPEGKGTYYSYDCMDAN